MSNKDELPEGNEDELVGYIMRRVGEEGFYLQGVTYDIVRKILDLELEFLRSKDIAGAEITD